MFIYSISFKMIEITRQIVTKLCINTVGLQKKGRDVVGVK